MEKAASLVELSGRVGRLGSVLQVRVQQWASKPAGGGAGVSYGSGNWLQEGQRSEVRPSRKSETKTVLSSRSSEKEI